ncbi:N-acetyllactosaminide beta-1,3-N-acetylglucosaminyltransferase 4-like [Pristis pectinata]|uniref:N-acetyllactosaminide beta-1,3-N-acetylglucosaminyltransferase 4-like n=1 Tax=Pristis pectinata TaxID=685728 RepID=UPI00223CC29C|nr:N-acetyllactosaminide beta-1,3-N-acetylglucosaminyltransferase 4-like [Pristis pectinata]
MAPKNRSAVTYTMLICGMQFVLIFSIAIIVGFSFCTQSNEKKLMFISYLHKSVWYSKPTPQQKNSINTTTHLTTAEAMAAPCLPNWTFNNLTANLKPIYKDFMVYRHCRDFTSIHKANVCKGKDIFLLLVIKSLAGNADRRASVRSTWGQERRVDGLSIRRVFLLGRMESQIHSQSVQSLVDHETKVYGDIIQWDFRESFFNVTLKETLFWKWFTEECQDVKFVLKGDDDMFVNVENLVEYLKEFDASQDLYVGDVFRNWYPDRVVSSKYYIPLFLYGKKPYPPYAGGGGYLLSGMSVRKLHNASKFEELFPIDDAFVGICAQRAKIEVVSHQGFRTFGNIPYDPCIYKMLMVIHRVTPNELWLIWSLLNDVTKQCVHSLKV